MLFLFGTFSLEHCSVLLISSSHTGKCPSFADYALIMLTVCSLRSVNSVFVPYPMLTSMGEVSVTVGISFLRSYMFNEVFSLRHFKYS